MVNQNVHYILFTTHHSQKIFERMLWSSESNSLLTIHHSLKIFRCLYRRCPPLPIPNREVKPARADGTAVKCGRVGRCQILSRTLSANADGVSCFMADQRQRTKDKRVFYPCSFVADQRQRTKDKRVLYPCSFVLSSLNIPGGWFTWFT